MNSLFESMPIIGVIIIAAICFIIALVWLVFPFYALGHLRAIREHLKTIANRPDLQAGILRPENYAQAAERTTRPAPGNTHDV